jgi:ribokinase
MSARKPVITVVGSFAVGMTIRAPHFPVGGETLRGSDFDMGPGGKGSNQAVGVARMGAESHLVAKVGQDLFAQIAINLYQREGVNTEYLFRTANCPTGVGFITLNASGENHIVLDMGANELLSPQDVDCTAPLIERSDIVMTVLEIRQETAARAMELGRQYGKTTIMNPAPAERLAPSIFSCIDFLPPNESELRILCGLRPDDPADTLDLAHRLQAQGVKNVIVTRGKEGALIVAANGLVEMVPSIPVQVVDTTGAGDAFNSALAMALAEQKPLVEAVRFAMYGGALACTRLGVIPSLPYRKDIDELINQRK